MVGKLSLLARVFGRPQRSNEDESTIRRLSLTTFPAAIYAVGDVHGCLELYLALETKIIADGAGTPGQKLIVLLGDIVDRGAQSAEMIEHLLQPTPAGFQRLTLMGNHEEMMLLFLNAPSRNLSWLGFGGRETLLSYGMLPDAGLGFALSETRLKQMSDVCIPQSHRTFLEQLPVSLSVGEYLFSHAGYDGTKPVADQKKEDLLWGDPTLLDAQARLIHAVHGHIPVDKVLFTEARTDVDTGAYTSGKLSAVKITPGGALTIITSSGDN